MANEDDLISKNKRIRRQVNQYDKILRENIEAALPGLIEIYCTSMQRHIQQLRILAQLRKFTQENFDIMDNIAGYFTKEKDILYILGEREAIEKGKMEFVTNLLTANRFTIAEIAKLANVSESFVEKVKKTLN